MTDLNIENLYIKIGEDVPFALEPTVAESYQDIVNVFDEAIDNDLAVRFIYRKTGNGDLSTIRTITPAVIQEARDGEEAVLGHDHDRGHARQFRLDRVEFACIDETVEPYRA